MSERLKKPPAFPTNYGWVMSNAHQYRPRTCTRETYLRMCVAFLRTDPDFVHLLRQCTDRWIVSIVLGQTSVYVNLYDVAQVDDPHARTMSQPAVLEQALFLEVDRTINLTRISAERVARVKTTHPMFYAVRHLRPQDMKMLDSMQDSFEADQGMAQASGPVSDILEQIRQAEAEEPIINRTPLLSHRIDSTNPSTK